MQDENAFYHVMNSGRGKRWIFHGDEYYDSFLATLEKAHDKHEAKFGKRQGSEIHRFAMYCSNRLGGFSQRK
ncbi:hypothetical protein AB833_06135 [Chromatiales bacterium (ex Bugula neritina AB1)]|nr:hypothetical protein AB833_06135 [Chromatiales bacterium (ex Bugula neritina AB1)]